jgi:hypothetical protein
MVGRPWKSGASAPRKPWGEETGFNPAQPAENPNRTRPWNPTLQKTKGRAPGRILGGAALQRCD